MLYIRICEYISIYIRALPKLYSLYNATRRIISFSSVLYWPATISQPLYDRFSQIILFRCTCFEDGFDPSHVPSIASQANLAFYIRLCFLSETRSSRTIDDWIEIVLFYQLLLRKWQVDSYKIVTSRWNEYNLRCVPILSSCIFMW